MHGIHAGDTFNDDVTSSSIDDDVKVKWEEGYRTLQSMVGDHPNVVAIFAGHIHDWVGSYLFGEIEFTSGTQSYPNGQDLSIRTERPDEFSATGAHPRTIPVLFGGGAEYNKYLRVGFKPDEMTVRVIDSRNGNATELFDDKVFETILGFKKTVKAGLPYNNTEEAFGLTVFECAKRCLGQSWCKSFDYRNSDKTCYFSDKSQDDVALKEDYPGDPWTYYHRP